MNSYSRQSNSGSRRPQSNVASSPDIPQPGDPNGQFSEYKGPAVYQKPSGKSNRKIMQNAISHCCLCGEVNKEAKKKCLEVCCVYMLRVAHSQQQQFYSVLVNIPQNKVNNRSSRKRYEICPDVTVKMPKRFHRHRSCLFEHISHFYAAMALWLRRWIPNPEVPCSKPLDDSKVDSAIHPSEVDKMSTRNLWEVVVKSKLPPQSDSKPGGS